jgi:acetoin utilization deacetylase AcuC-like enzyme
MKTTAYVTHSDCSLHDTGWRHPEHQGRLPAVARAVYRDMLTLFDPLLELEAVPAAEADLLLAHDQGYVDRVRARCEEAADAGEVLVLEGDTRVSGASWRAALAAVGSALTAVDAVLRGDVRNAFCAVRPPGHGAGRDSTSHFALFNPAAIAARHLVRRAGLSRVLIVEWGAAGGAGTLDVVRGDPAIGFLSLHSASAPLPPTEGAYLRALPAGSDGADLLRALEERLDRAVADASPDFILLSLGCDALATDPRGDLDLQPDDYYALTLALRDRAERVCGGMLVSVLEEGYDSAGMGQAVLRHLHALAGL